MTHTTRHVTLKWHLKRKCRCRLTFVFIFENVSWHSRFEVERQIKFVKHTHCGGCHLHFPHIRAIKFFLVLSINPLHILSMCSIILDGDGFVQAVGNAVDQLCGSNYLVPLTKCRYCTTYTHSALYSVLRAFLHSIWNMKCTRNHERLLVKFIPHLQTIICDTPYTPHSTFVTIM